MKLLYGDFNDLATGGAIGDALFFFCSGCTLFLGRISVSLLLTTVGKVSSWIRYHRLVYGADKRKSEFVFH